MLEHQPPDAAYHPAVPFHTICIGHSPQREQEEERIEPDTLRYLMGPAAVVQGIVQKTEIRTCHGHPGAGIADDLFVLYLLTDFQGRRQISLSILRLLQALQPEAQPGVEHPEPCLVS